jgi:2'-5' RNA ligase
VPRLFVALDLPADVKTDLARLCHGLPGAKWRNLAQFHLTLRFIGEVDGAQARDIGQALAPIELPAFELALRGVNHFGNRKRPRVLWSGVHETRPVNRLNRRIQRVLAEIGLPPEKRKFRPHVTLAHLNGARMTDVNDFEAAFGGFATRPFRIEAFHLFASFLSSSGAIYTAEADYPLIGAADPPGDLI